MALLFRLLVTLAVLLAAVICEGQQEVVLQDAFNPDLQRTWNLSQPATAADWRLEQKIPAAQGKLFCRFFSGTVPLQQLRLLNREGQEVWRATTFTKALLLPQLSPNADEPHIRSLVQALPITNTPSPVGGNYYLSFLHQPSHAEANR